MSRGFPCPDLASLTRYVSVGCCVGGLQWCVGGQQWCVGGQQWCVGGQQWCVGGLQWCVGVTTPMYSHACLY